MDILPFITILLHSVYSTCNISISDYSNCPDYKIPDSIKVLQFLNKIDYCGYDIAENEYISKQLCGWRGMSKKDCARAGCCYNLTTKFCYYPIRPQRSEFSFNSSLLTYDDAEIMCSNQGMRLFCPRSELDLQILDTHSCGVTWLRGEMTSSEFSKNYTLPYYNHTSCQSKTFACDIGHPSDGRLTFIRGYPTLHLTHVDKSRRLYSLCVKEEWSLRLFVYPKHFLYTENSTGYHSMRCSVEYMGSLEVVGRWKFVSFNNTVTQSTRTYTAKKYGIYRNNFYFFKIIAESEIGRYECSFSFWDAEPEEKTEHIDMRLGGYAYIYSVQECNATVHIEDDSISTSYVISGKGNVIETLAGVTVTINVLCKGYPVPVVFASIQNETGISIPYPPTIRTGPNAAYARWIISDFATEVKPWLKFESTISLEFHSTISDLASMSITLRKVFVRFSNKIPEKEYVLKKGDSKLTLTCEGYGFGALYKADSTWQLNGRRLDYDDPALRDYISVERDNGAVNITLNPISAVVSGNYTCTIDTGTGNPEVYSTLIKIEAPPLPPSQPYVKEVNNTTHVMTAAIPLHNDVWNTTDYKTVLIVNDSQRIESHSVEQTDTEILSYFNLTEGSRYQVMFGISNKWGHSEDTEPSEVFTYTKGFPTVPPMLQSSDESVNEIQIELGEIEGVDEYELTLYDANNNIVSTIRSVSSDIELTDLTPDTNYFIAVRGLKTLENGEKVSGPMSKRIPLETQSATIPAPVGFKGNQLENDGVVATVLLRWEAPKMKMSLLDGFLLSIKLIDEVSKEKRQALQTIPISYTASAFVAKELKSGATYEFGLQCVTKQGTSEPAKSLVETTENINCPPEKLSTTECEQPRISADEKHVAYIAERSTVKDDIECYRDQGIEYRGSVNQTRASFDCVLWSKERLAKLNLTVNDPELFTHNYCRNFKGFNFSAPWCFNTQEEWEECGVNICGHDNVTVTRTKLDGTLLTTAGYTSRFICLELAEDEVEIKFSSEKIYGSLDCKSSPSPPVGLKVTRNKWIGKIWVKYLIIEVVLFSVLVFMWIFLGMRRGIIVRRGSIQSNSARTVSTSVPRSKPRGR